MRALPFLLLALALTLPRPAEARVRTWVGVDGALATYAMRDVNREIRAINDIYSENGAPIDMDQIKGGSSFGGRLGVDLPGGLVLGLGYERLAAASDKNQIGIGVKYDYPATTLRGFAEYGLPGVTALRLGVAAGGVSENGTLEIRPPYGGFESLKLTGSGPLFEAYMSGDAWVFSRLGLSGSFGYRRAVVGEVKGESGGVKETLYNEDGSKFRTDYSGVFARLGVKLAVTK